MATRLRLYARSRNSGCRTAVASSAEMTRSRSLSTSQALQPSAGRLPRVLVLGSGWAAFTLLRKLDRTRVDVSCVSPANHFTFTPLLPSSALGTVEFRAIQEPIRGVLPRGYHQAKARSVDLRARLVECEDIFQGTRFTLDYDVLVIATGCKSNVFNTPGILEREGREVHFLKNLWHARNIRNRILQCFELASIRPHERERLLSFVVVGGGPTSVEFVGELHDFVREDVARFFPDLKSSIHVTLVEAGGHLLGTFDAKLVSYVERRFLRRGIDVRLNTAVTSLSPDGTTVHFSDGRTLPCGMLVWSAGLAPVKFVEGLPKEIRRAGPSKRLFIDDHLALASPEAGDRVFALGDCAVNEVKPLAQLAQVARRQAEHLGAALNKISQDALIENPGRAVRETTAPFKYQNLLMMATLGGWRGVVDFTHVGDPHDNKRKLNFGAFTGFASFLLWRSAYWGYQVSPANKLLIPVYWLKAWIFGRDVSSF